MARPHRTPPPGFRQARPICVMKIAATADDMIKFDPPLYLKSFDVQTGEIVLTPSKALAIKFVTTMGAYTLWMSVPRSPEHRMRFDGQPNRPLTAFHLETEGL